MSNWKLIKSRVAGKVPSVNQVDEDTLALNQFDAILYALRVQNGVKQVVAIGGSGSSEPGADGREIELQKTATHIQWRYVGGTWANLVALSDITGDDGAPGDDGREIELQKSLTHIQWRYVGVATWTNLVALADITGDDGAPGSPGEDGREIELRKTSTQIQWRYVGSASWSVLVLLADITGNDGAPGSDGADGADGREIELQKTATHIQWRYVGGSWVNLVALADITGPAGADASVDMIIASGKRKTVFGQSGENLTFPSEQINIAGSIYQDYQFGGSFGVGDVVEISGYITLDYANSSTEGSVYVKLHKIQSLASTEITRIGFEIVRNTRHTVPFNITYLISSAGTTRFYLVYPDQGGDVSVPYAAITVKRIYKA